MILAGIIIRIKNRKIDIIIRTNARPYLDNSCSVQIKPVISVRGSFSSLSAGGYTLAYYCGNKTEVSKKKINTV